MKLLDVTLREGEQRPGVSYSVDQKATVARQLDDLGVSFVQLGFPVADDRTRRACSRLAIDTKTVGIARAVPSDVTAALDAGVDVVEVFAPTSDRQLTQVLGVGRAEVLDRIREAVALVSDAGADLHFTAMDGFRTDPAFVDDVFAAVDGAEWLTVADTVGCRTPAGVTERLRALDTDLSRVGVHFHDDLGVGTANALAAARAGVGKVDASVAGLGERAGNTPLEEFVAAASVGESEAPAGLDATGLLPACESVLATLGEAPNWTKPLLDPEAFAHESGLHTAAMLADPATFEPFDPGRFGGERRLTFGSASGRGAARRLLERAGRPSTEDRVARLLEDLHSADGVLELDEALERARSVD